jgi:hypothetical protein
MNYNSAMVAKTMRRIVVENKMLLRLPGYRINEVCHEIAHHKLQAISYHIPYLNAIPKKQQNFLKNSTANNELFTLAVSDVDCKHDFSCSLICLNCHYDAGGFQPSPDWQNTSESDFESSEPSKYDLKRALRLISFWMINLVWISSQNAQPVLPDASVIPFETEGVWVETSLAQGSITFICEFPAAHGLGATNSTTSLLSTHAALVTFKKQEPRRTRRNAKCSPFYLKKISDHEKGPNPAQGMNHTLVLAPLGFALHNKPFTINSRPGTGDTWPVYRPNPTLPLQVISPVPPRLYYYFFIADNLKLHLIAPYGGTFRVNRQGITVLSVLSVQSLPIGDMFITHNAPRRFF